MINLNRSTPALAAMPYPLAFFLFPSRKKNVSYQATYANVICVMLKEALVMRLVLFDGDNNYLEEKLWDSQKNLILKI